MAGIILSPTILGLGSSFQEQLFPEMGETFLNFFERIAFDFFIFLWGVKMDLKMVMKTGWKAWILGVSAYVLPLSFTTLLTKYAKKASDSSKWNIIEYIIAAHRYVSFPMVASILVHLRIINTELGHLASSSSLIANLLGLTSRAVLFALYQNGLYGLLEYVVPHVVFVLYIIVIVKPISHLIIKETPGSRPVKREFIMIIVTLLLFTILLADLLGVPHEVGAFLTGLLGVPDGPPLGSSLVQKLETFVDGVLAPLMLSYCGSKVNLVRLHDMKFIGTMWLIVACCLVIKMVSFVLPALILKVPPRDSLTFALVLSSEGIVHISYHLFLLTVEVYDDDAFTMMVLSVLLIAALMDTIAQLTYDYSFTYTGYKKRTIEHEGVNGELSVLAGIYRFDDVFAVRRLLEASMPDERSPATVSVVNLVELVGRATPQLIDHNCGQKELFSNVPRLQELLDIFVDFELKYRSLLQLQFFSVISMLRFMHQDVCSLAFKQSVSLIILPFHRKWNHQGKVILDNVNVRDVNSKVLDMSPCSVGILVQKTHHSSLINSSSLYKVGVVFIGGADDIEALSYGKRLARSISVNLTVVHLVEPDVDPLESQWEKLLDEEALRDLKVASEEVDNIVIKDEVVKDGTDTAVRVHELEDSCDLVLVGRRHDNTLPQLYGLTEWNEFPELGHIGDVLATSEMHKPLSILVVQQQTLKPM